MLKVFLRSFFPTLYHKIRFYKRRHYWPDIDNPKTINEFILQLKLRSSPETAHLVDKLRVRDYIKNIVDETGIDLRFSEISTIFDSVEQINLAELSEDWFIKANHGSGMAILFSPANQNDPQQILQTIGKWYQTNYALISGERCYEGIKPKVFLETPLRCKDGSLPDDIKIHCYFGVPKVVQVLRRTGDELERKTFDEHWQEQNWFENETLAVNLNHIPQQDSLLVAEKLAAGFEYVRVDFYNVDGVLYFSELTFFPASSALPLLSKQVDELLGGIYRKIKDSYPAKEDSPVK